MRVFFAFDLDEAALDAVVRTMSSLNVANVKWCSREKLHVTARFVGDVDEAAIGPLASSLNGIASGAIPVRMQRVDGFPNPRRANVVVAAIEPEPAIERIVRQLEACVVALGHAPETRAFRPHLTLARARRAVDVRTAGSIDVRGMLVGLTLYESKNGYRPLARIPLA